MSATMIGVPPIRTIATPADLTSLIRALKAAVAAGTIEQIRPNASPFSTEMELVDLSEQGPWPDCIEMRFQVRGTAIRYKLTAETYHGAGGSWAPD